MGKDLFEQSLASCGRQLFGIIKPVGNSVGVKDHGGCNNRSGQRSASRLIGTGNKALRCQGFTLKGIIGAIFGDVKKRLLPFGGGVAFCSSP